MRRRHVALHSLMIVLLSVVVTADRPDAWGQQPPAREDLPLSVVDQGSVPNHRARSIDASRERANGPPASTSVTPVRFRLADGGEPTLTVGRASTIPAPENPGRKSAIPLVRTAGDLARGLSGAKRPPALQNDLIRKRVQEALKNGHGPAVFAEARRVTLSRLKADREARFPRVVAATASLEAKIAAAQARAARKLELLPLAPPRYVQAAMSRASVRQPDIDRLTKMLETADNPPERDRLNLRLAAAFVGAGDWPQAQAIYRTLAQTTADEGIRHTAWRNLDIVAARLPGPPGPATNSPQLRPKAAPGNGGAP